MGNWKKELANNDESAVKKGNRIMLKVKIQSITNGVSKGKFINTKEGNGCDEKNEGVSEEVMPA